MHFHFYERKDIAWKDQGVIFLTNLGYNNRPEPRQGHNQQSANTIEYQNSPNTLWQARSCKKRKVFKVNLCF